MTPSKSVRAIVRDRKSTKRVVRLGSKSCERNGSQPPRTLAEMANVGPATLADFKVLRIERVDQLAKLKPQDAFRLWNKLGRLTGHRHDPCVIDLFLSVISQANADKPRPWWHFTSQRKAMQQA